MKRKSIFDRQLERLTAQAISESQGVIGRALSAKFGCADDRVNEIADAHLAKLREATARGAVMGVCQPFGPGHRGHR